MLVDIGVICMKYPKLVINAQTEISVTLYADEIGECGERVAVIEGKKLKCNYQDKARKVLTKDKEELQITGTAYFDGDIAPELPVISSGNVMLYDKAFTIVEGQKARNLDGSVNYTELWLV